MVAETSTNNFRFAPAEPTLADTPEALAHWLRPFIQIHRGARDWCIRRTREFLSVPHA